MPPSNLTVAELVALLEEGFHHRAWHGPNLLGSLRGLTPVRAAWRPAPGRHNIWEVIVHTAYWKYAVTRRLTGGKRGSFPESGSNWFPRHAGSAADLKRDITLLKRCHQELLAQVARLGPRELRARPPGTKWNRGAMIRGVACHDVYHAGQIQLLKRLAPGG